METKKLQYNIFTVLKNRTVATLLFIFGIAIMQAQTNDKNSCSDFNIYNDGQGHSFELWQSDKGYYNGCMDIKDNGDFFVQWTRTYNTLARKSVRPGAKNQKIDYYVNNSFEGNVFFGAYGWWRSPNETGHKDLVEYYVVEDYGVNKPTDNMPKVGEVVSDDGGVYEIYIGQKTGQPSIDADSDNFTQIKAIRKVSRSSGAITMANHFNKWAQLGYPAGNLFEVSMKIEGFSNGHDEDPCYGEAYVVANFSNAGTYNPNQGNSNNTSSSGDINGTFRLKARAGGRYPTSNNTNWATVKETGFENWSSQHWTFEHVSGNIYRLKEEYGGRYLSGNASSESVEVADLDSNGDAQKWALEAVGSRYRLKCLWGNKYLTSPNSDWGSLSVKSGSNGNNRQWTLEPLPKSASSFTGTPISNNTHKNISIYPNPSKDFVNLSFTGFEFDEESSVMIFDMQGRVINAISDIKKLTTINTSTLPKGTYLMRITTKAGSDIKRFSKS